MAVELQQIWNQNFLPTIIHYNVKDDCTAIRFIVYPKLDYVTVIVEDWADGLIDVSATLLPKEVVEKRYKIKL